MIASRSRSTNLATSAESLFLSKNLAAMFFSSNACDFFSISSNVLGRRLRMVVVVSDHQQTNLENVERRWISSSSPSAVVAAMSCLNLSNRGTSSLILSLTSWNSYEGLCKLCAHLSTQQIPRSVWQGRSRRRGQTVREGTNWKILSQCRRISSQHPRLSAFSLAGR